MALLERLYKMRDDLDEAIAEAEADSRRTTVRGGGKKKAGAAATTDTAGECPGGCGAKREQRVAANGFGPTRYVCGACGADWNN